MKFWSTTTPDKVWSFGPAPTGKQAWFQESAGELFIIPENLDDDVRNKILWAYEHGFHAGIKIGEKRTRNKIRDALGIDKLF